MRYLVCTMLVLSLGLLGFCGSEPLSSQPAPPAQKPEALPVKLVAVWEGAGAEAGWMGLHRRMNAVLFTRSLDDFDAAHSVAAFRIQVWREGMLSQLPAPSQPF